MSIVNCLSDLFNSKMFTTLYEKLQQDGVLQKVYEENYKGKIYQVEVYEYKDKDYTVKLKNNVVQVIYSRG